MPDSGFCTDCGVHIDSFEGLEACPNCGSTGKPCADANQVTVSVNWHELRLLTIWAERFAHTFNGAGTVYAIAQRLQKQFPDRTPLTPAGEIAQLKQQFGSENVETNIPGVE